MSITKQEARDAIELAQLIVIHDERSMDVGHYFARLEAMPVAVQAMAWAMMLSKHLSLTRTAKAEFVRFSHLFVDEFALRDPHPRQPPAEYTMFLDGYMAALTWDTECDRLRRGHYLKQEDKP